MLAKEDDMPQPALRADARRNRARLLEVAAEAFATGGLTVPFDEIAKRAGVGPGTLYRHFPTREALFDAVMRDWADRVNADSQAAATSDLPPREALAGWPARATADSRAPATSDLPPREALAGWFSRFVENVGIYHGAAAKVMAAMDDPASPIYPKCQILVGANQKVLDSVRD